MESYFAKLFSYLKLIIYFCITYSFRQAPGPIIRNIHDAELEQKEDKGTINQLVQTTNPYSLT